MQFAKWVYRVAGIYGLLFVVPLYFLEAQTGVNFPPPITHPEYYYGFAGVTLAWQIAFLIIARDPSRYRPLMLATVVEKYSYGLAALALFAQGRIVMAVLTFALIDLVLGTLFVIAYQKTRE
ncbi:MAG: hypothetical protein R3A44_03005 [Caldilineaceae bacterium]